MAEATIPYYEVVAFTRHLFSGNPAAVCLLDSDDWLPDATLQSIAHENNFAETAFLRRNGNAWHIRWLTPSVEVDLCGHATLAAAHVLFQHQDERGDTIRFESKSGSLFVHRDGERLVLDFPSQPPKSVPASPELSRALGAEPAGLWSGGHNFLALLRDQAQVESLMPHFDALRRLDAQGVVVTAPGTQCDFVSRYFAPAAGIPEDPVTGSTHCMLIPFWAHRLGKQKLLARQLSKRQGELFCEDRDDRVAIGGHARTYVSGTLHIGNAQAARPHSEE